MSTKRTMVYDFATLPDGCHLRSVTALPVEVAGRKALRVELTDKVTLEGRPGADYIDMPTFVVLPVEMTNGTISIDIMSRLNRNAPDYARAFAGVAYRIADGGDHFEAVYLRPLNGLKANPPPPRDRRAVQYFAYPDWKFDRLREAYPDGRYEDGADIGPNEWNTLKLDIHGTRVVASVNGKQVLVVNETKSVPVVGAIGLFVDIGTEAYFSNLVVSPDASCG